MATEEENKHEAGSAEGENGGAQASRARNRTVMLTPEITGEVRARLAQDMATESPAAPVTPAMAEPSAHAEAGFHSPGSTPPAAGAPVSPPPEHPARPSGGAMTVAAEPTPPSPYLVRQGVIWSKPSTVAGFLVSYDEDENGEVFELRMGRLIVTSEPPGAGNFLVLDHDTVSSMHAIIRMSSFGEIQILDQLSEYGTRILRGDSGKEEDLSGDKSILHHGDTVFFGERKFSVCLISRGDEED